MASAELAAPAEAQPVPSPSLSYESLRDELFRLIDHFRLVEQAVDPHQQTPAGTVLHDAVDDLDQLQERLEAWYEDHVIEKDL